MEGFRGESYGNTKYFVVYHCKDDGEVCLGRMTCTTRQMLALHHRPQQYREILRPSERFVPRYHHARRKHYREVVNV